MSGLARDETVELYRETKRSGANGDRENIIFSTQVTTIGIDNHTRLIHSAERAGGTFWTSLTKSLSNLGQQLREESSSLPTVILEESSLDRNFGRGLTVGLGCVLVIALI